MALPRGGEAQAQMLFSEALALQRIALQVARPALLRAWRRRRDPAPPRPLGAGGVTPRPPRLAPEARPRPRAMARGTPQKTTPKKATPRKGGAAVALEGPAASPALDVNHALMARVEEALDRISKVTVAVAAGDPQRLRTRPLV